MNKRQKKKFWSTHVEMTNRYTGRKSIISVKKLKEIFDICEFTQDEIMALFARWEDAHD